MQVIHAAVLSLIVVSHSGDDKSSRLALRNLLRRFELKEPSATARKRTVITSSTASIATAIMPQHGVEGCCNEGPCEFDHCKEEHSRNEAVESYEDEGSVDEEFVCTFALGEFLYILLQIATLPGKSMTKSVGKTDLEKKFSFL
jgi:hypothetical protein